MEFIIHPDQGQIRSEFSLTVYTSSLFFVPTSIVDTDVFRLFLSGTTSLSSLTIVMGKNDWPDEILPRTNYRLDQKVFGVYE